MFLFTQFKTFQNPCNLCILFTFSRIRLQRSIFYALFHDPIHTKFIPLTNPSKDLSHAYQHQDLSIHSLNHATLYLSLLFLYLSQITVYYIYFSNYHLQDSQGNSYLPVILIPNFLIGINIWLT